jgi:hypothetical protein
MRYEVSLYDGWKSYDEAEFDNLEDVRKFIDENEDDCGPEEYYEVWDNKDNRWLTDGWDF